MNFEIYPRRNGINETFDLCLIVALQFLISGAFRSLLHGGEVSVGHVLDLVPAVWREEGAEQFSSVGVVFEEFCEFLFCRR